MTGRYASLSATITSASGGAVRPLRRRKACQAACFSAGEFIGKAYWVLNRKRSLASLERGSHGVGQLFAIEFFISTQNPQIEKIFHARVESREFYNRLELLCNDGFERVDA